VKPSWRVVGASARGISHQKDDVPCQDAHGYAVVSNRAVIVVVADGAGSADRSDKGAQLAAKGALFLLKRILEKGVPQDESVWGKMLLWVFDRVRRRIIKLSEEENAPLRAFHTTLACAVASEKWLATAQVGDNVVVAQTHEGRFFAASQPQRGEYANETFFLTMENGLQYVQTRVYFVPICAVAVMSDGLSRLAMAQNKEAYVPFFQPILDFVNQSNDISKAREQLKAFLESDRVCARTDDDKTLVVALHCLSR
jgi:serine/threonine protein phosphatase PrpC